MPYGQTEGLGVMDDNIFHCALIKRLNFLKSALMIYKNFGED